jgi:hypothetical protein
MILVFVNFFTKMSLQTDPSHRKETMYAIQLQEALIRLETLERESVAAPPDIGELAAQLYR